MIKIRNSSDGVLDIVCSSEFEHLDAIVDNAESFLASSIVDDELAYKVVLLLSEAVTNAIEHGNKFDSGKQVYTKIEVASDKISIRVEDQGEGFDKSDVKNPIQNENLLSDGGRGLFFIKEMADEYRIDDGGRTMHIIFKR